MKAQTVTLQERIQKTVKDIKLLKADQRVLIAQREKCLIDETPMKQINGEISDNQRRIAEKTVLLQALEHGKTEAEKQEKETQKQARIKELETEATEIRREVIRLVDDLERHWEDVETTIDALDKTVERTRQIRDETRGLGASNILANLPSPNVAIFLNEVPRANLQNVFKRIKNQLKKG